MHSDFQAEQGAIEAFFNSLAREWPACRLLPTPERECAWDLEVPVEPLGGVLRIALTHRSRAGRHGFRLPVRLRLADGVEKPVAFATAIAAAAEAVARSRSLGGAAQRRFVERVLESTDTIEAALRARAARPPSGAAPADFLTSEQTLVLGHSLHPAPRSATELRPERAEFMPEFAPAFRLRWALVRPDALVFEDVAGRNAGALLRDLGAPCEVGRIAVPMHPWQARSLASQPEFTDLLARDAVRIVDGADGETWHPTASVRSLYCPRAPWMLKFSLGARVTNSVRILFPTELARGKDVSRLLRSTIGSQVGRLAPDLEFLEEPAHFGLRNGGHVLRESLVIVRSNPFVGFAARNVAMLATLCQIDPASGRTPLSALVGEAAARAGMPLREAGLDWFGRLVDLLPLPLARLRCRLGLLFGAHQQNALVLLRDGWPVRAYVRDCQGSGHVEGFHERLAAEVPGLGLAAEAVVPDEVGNRLLGYYVIVNGLFGLVAAMSRDGLANEAAMFGLVRKRLERERAARPPDPSFLDYLLGTPMLAAKGNFMTFLEDVVENLGTREQRAIYHDFPNPLSERIPA